MRIFGLVYFLAVSTLAVATDLGQKCFHEYITRFDQVEKATLAAIKANQFSIVACLMREWGMRDFATKNRPWTSF